MDDEDLIQREDMVVLVSHAGSSSARPYRPIGRNGAAARAAPAWRRARRISSRGCSSPRPISRCCSSPRPDRSTRRRSGACRWPRPGRGKALVDNLLPLKADDRITTIMPLPEDEATWKSFVWMFAAKGAPRRGDQREDRLLVARSNRSGRRAMGLDSGERIIEDIRSAADQRRHAADDAGRVDRLQDRRRRVRRAELRRSAIRRHPRWRRSQHHVARHPQLLSRRDYSEHHSPPQAAPGRSGEAAEGRGSPAAVKPENAPQPAMPALPPERFEGDPAPNR